MSVLCTLCKHQDETQRYVRQPLPLRGLESSGGEKCAQIIDYKKAHYTGRTVCTYEHCRNDLLVLLNFTLHICCRVLGKFYRNTHTKT